MTFEPERAACLNLSCSEDGVGVGVGGGEMVADREVLGSAWVNIEPAC